MFLALCTGLTALLSLVNDDNNAFAASLYILCVALVARFTEGYVYGIAASLLGVLCVNFFFTSPFLRFDLSLTGYPLTFLSMLLVSLTISALSSRLLEQERLRYAARQEKMRADLLRSVSHDLRTPLAAILGASAALRENPALDEAQRQEMLLGIQRDADWLSRVVENLLTLTRANAEGMELKKTMEAAEEIVGSAIVAYHKRPGSLPVAVEAPDGIVLAPMNALLMEQLLINLFENAQLHGETVSKLTLRYWLEGEKLYFSIDDDGVGFPPERLKAPFSFAPAPDGRLRADGRRDMGLGLSVCAAILHAHGGGMTLSNGASGGASVRFWLPGGEEEAWEQD